MTADPLQILLAHNDWANRLILDRCAALSDEELHRRFPIGPGSVHDTLDHLLGCTLRWVRRLDGDVPEPDGGRFTVEQFRDRNDRATAAMKEAIARYAGRLHEIKQTRLGDRTYTFTVGVGLTHALVHGTHHRAQILNMLRQLGRPLDRDIDVNDWQFENERPSETETHHA